MANEEGKPEEGAEHVERFVRVMFSTIGEAQSIELVNVGPTMVGGAADVLFDLARELRAGLVVAALEKIAGGRVEILKPRRLL